jgi:hypothetical protein
MENMDLLKIFENKEVLVFCKSKMRFLGNLRQISKNFIKIEDIKLGMMIISIDDISNMHANKKIMGNKNGKNN